VLVALPSRRDREQRESAETRGCVKVNKRNLSCGLDILLGENCKVTERGGGGLTRRKSETSVVGEKGNFKRSILFCCPGIEKN